MKKPKIKIRSVVYSLLGVSISSVAVLMLLSQIPSIPTVRTELKNFPGGVILEPQPTELIETPIEGEKPLIGIEFSQFILGDNSYHIQENHIQNYIKEGVFHYGRWNPMFYKVLEKVETQTSDEVLPPTKPIDKTPVKPTEDKPTGIKLDTPEGEVILEYTTGKMPVEERLYKVEKIYGLIGTDFHYGIDIASEGIKDAEVYAVLPGIISNVGKTEEYGNYVVINHGKISSLYAHLQEGIPVTNGERVLMGDVLGYVGQSGNTDHEHSHFEMDVAGVRFNPEIFIKQIEI